MLYSKSLKIIIRPHLLAGKNDYKYLSHENKYEIQRVFDVFKAMFIHQKSLIKQIQVKPSQYPLF